MYQMKRGKSNDEKIKTSVLDGALWRTDRSLRFYLDIINVYPFLVTKFVRKTRDS